MSKYINKAVTPGTLTDAGTFELDTFSADADNVGTVIYTATGTKATGTFSASAQLQGANDSGFLRGVIDIGSPVVLSDTVTGLISLSALATDNDIEFAYYRVQITGSGTQSTTIVGTLTAKTERRGIS